MEKCSRKKGKQKIGKLAYFSCPVAYLGWGYLIMILYSLHLSLKPSFTKTLNARKCKFEVLTHSLLKMLTNDYRSSQMSCHHHVNEK